MDKDWKPFVQNWVEKIRQLVPVQYWSHCSGKDNPANIPSRGLNPTALSLSELWRNRPDWLGRDLEGRSPEFGDLIPESCVEELKANSRVDFPHALFTHQIS